MSSRRHYCGYDFSGIDYYPPDPVRRVPRFDNNGLTHSGSFGPAAEMAAAARERAAAQPQRKPNCFDLLRKAWASGHTLPTDSAERKEFPVRTGCYDYIPAALVAFAGLSKLGNDQHNPGQPLHHARDKSPDHGDCLARHGIDSGDPNLDELREATAEFWRAGLRLQILAEKLGAPMAPGAKEPK